MKHVKTLSRESVLVAKAASSYGPLYIIKCMLAGSNPLCCIGSYLVSKGCQTE